MKFINFNPTQTDAIEKKRIESVTQGLLLITLIVLVFLSLYELSITHLRNTGTIIIYIYTGAVSLMTLYYRKFKSRLVGITFLLTIWLMLAFAAWYGEGAKSVAVIAYILIIQMSILMAEFTVSIILVFGSIFSLWIFTYAEMHAIIHPVFNPVNHNSVEFTLVFVLIFFLIIFTSNEHKLSYKRLKDEFEEKLKMKKKLQESEALYQSIFESANDAIFLMKFEKFIEFNKKTITLFGCTREEILNKSPIDFSPEYQSDGQLSKKKAYFLINQALQGQPQRFEWKHKKMDGTLFDAEVSLNRVEINGEFILTAIVRDVSERKNAENKLAEEQIKLSSVLESTNDMIWAVNSEDYSLITFNHVLKDYYWDNFHVELFEGIIPHKYLPPEYQELWPVLYEKAIKYGAFQMEYKVSMGTKILFLSVSPLVYNGKTFGVSVFGRDITEQTKAENALKISEEKFAKAFTTSPIAISINELETAKFVECNDALINSIGYTRDELIGKSSVELGIWPDLKTRNAAINQLRNTGTIKDAEIDYMTKSGKIINTLVSSEILKYAGGNYILSVIVDITERKKNERALKNSEERLQKLLDSVTDYIYTVKTEKGKIVETYHGEGCKTVTGYSSEQFNADSYLWFNIIFDEDKSKVEEWARNIFSNNEITTIEHRIIHKSGQLRWVSNTPVLIRNTDGNLIGYDGLISDITARKNAEEKLKQSEEMYRLLAENIDDVIWKLDPKTLRFTYVSPSITKLRGISVEEAINQDLENALTADSLEIVKNLVSERMQNLSGYKHYSDQVKQPCKDGSIVWVEINTSFMNYTDGRAPEIIGVSRNITEKKATERKILNAIIEAEERERNYFARELHDGIGPLLSSIKLYFQWMNMPNPNAPKEEIVKKANDTIHETIASIKEISHKLSPHLLMNFGLEFAVNSYIEKLNEAGKLKIKFSSNLKERLIRDIEITIYRVIIESINNTLKYAEAFNISINISKKSKAITLNYTDDGIGFDYEKVRSSGKGLGLFNMQSRIETLGGTFSIDTKPGKGVKIKASISL